MKKQDLKDGMILEIRNGQRYLLTNGIMRNLYGFTVLENYSDDLKYGHSKDYDIIKVYKDTMAYSLTTILDDEYLDLIWERKEIKLTDREIEVLKALKTLGYEWLARDENGELYAYYDKPTKDHNYIFWMDDYHCFLTNGETLFNFVKWEDNEPTKIEDLLKGV